MENENKYEIIEGYILGTLEKLEKENFEAQLSTDNDLRKEYLLQKSLHEEFSDDVMDLKSKLNDITSDKSPLSIVEDKPTFNLIKYAKYISIAAVFALGIIMLPKLLNPSMDESQLYASYYEPYPMVLNQRSNIDDDTNIKLNDAIKSYLDLDYTNAISQFIDLHSSLNDDIYLLYKANALQADNKIREALTDYNIVIENSNPQYIEQAQWYKGLCLLELGEKEKALTFFKGLNEEHYKNSEIKLILETLK